MSLDFLKKLSSIRLGYKTIVSQSQLRELVIFALFFVVALIFREKPDVKKLELEINRTLVNKSSVVETTKDIRNATGEEVSNYGMPFDNKSAESLKVLESRNPFSSDGSYLDIALPENPYMLVAILSGKEAKALIKNFTGDLVVVKKGDTLIDGAKVKKITEKSLIVTKDGKDRELKIFNVEIERWKPKN